MLLPSLILAVTVSTTPFVSDELASSPVQLFNQYGSVTRAGSVAWTETTGLLAWTQNNDQPQVFIVPLSPDGHATAAAIALRFTAGAFTENAAVATNGRDFLVAWWQLVLGGLELRALHVDANGQPLDLAPQSLVPIYAPLAGDGAIPAVAWTGSGYLVGTSLGFWEVTADGAHMGGFGAFDSSMANFGATVDVDQVAMIGDTPMMVVHSSYKPGGCFAHACDPPFHFSVLIAASGRGSSYSDSIEKNTHVPSMACSPSECLAVWTDGDDGEPGVVVGWFVDASGRPMTPLPRALGGPSRVPVRAGGSQVAWDGERFLVIWPDLSLGTDTDIVGVYVEPDRTIDPMFTIAATPRDERRPFIAAAGSGRVLVGYEVIEGANSRIAGRFVSRHAPPPTPRRRP